MATVADDALNGQAVNRMLGAGADVAQAFQQGILRMTNDYNQLAVSAARTFETNTQLLTYNGAMELSGNAMQLQAGILNARSVMAQPQTTGTAVNPGVNQAAPPVVYSVNPTTAAHHESLTHGRLALSRRGNERQRTDESHVDAGGSRRGSTGRGDDHSAASASTSKHSAGSSRSGEPRSRKAGLAGGSSGQCSVVARRGRLAESLD